MRLIRILPAISIIATLLFATPVNAAGTQAAISIHDVAHFNPTTFSFPGAALSVSVLGLFRLARVALSPGPITATTNTPSPHTRQRRHSILKASTSNYPSQTANSTAASKHPSSQVSHGA